MTISSVHAPSEAAAHDAEDRAAMWVFIIGDLFVFLGWFTFYFYYRASEESLFLAAQTHLDLTLGLINTLILLVSSWAVALGLHAARSGRYARARGFTWLPMLCAAAFGVSKIVEWQAEIAAGHSFTADDFFMFYYFLTGIHLFHVMMGMSVLGVMLRELRAPAPSDTVISNCAVFWHLVDLLWVVIFALVYLLR